jgi:tetrahydromethanopterin S-methyltransferase subunit G
MYNVRESWTDERLDDFAKHVDHRFDEVDHRFDEVDRRFDEVNRRIDEVDKKFDKRFDLVDHELLDAMNKAMVYAVLTLTSSILILASLILTQH